MTDEITRIQKAWEQRPTETAKQFAAFMTYLKLLPYGDGLERRTIVNVGKILGLASVTRLVEWSGINEWPARALAYDAAMAYTTIAIKETALADYQQGVIDSLSTQLILLNNIIEVTMKKMKEAADAGEIDITGLKKLTETIRVKDDLARRIGRMATQFKTEDSEEEEIEERTYIIGQ